jgi:geranylgeranyl transferase type-2 subunit beta
MQSTCSFEYFATEHFRLSGVYWGLTALYLLNEDETLSEKEIIQWVISCQHGNGGFGGSERNDPHLLYTLSALQILAIYNRLDLIDSDKIAECM